MINIKPIIYKELQKIADNVTDTYPADWENFPVVIFLEEENKPAEWYGEAEQKTFVRYKIDIFNRDTTSELALEVNRVFSNCGLRRTSSVDTPDPTGLRHKVMRFEGIVDLSDELVYQQRMEG